MSTNYKHSYEKRTKCQCPRCNKIHYLYVYWTGRGIPKYYCQACGLLVNYTNELNEYKLNSKIKHYYKLKGE